MQTVRVTTGDQIEEIPDIWLAGFCTANGCSVQDAVAFWLQQSEMARQMDEES